MLCASGTTASLSISGQIMTLWSLSQNRQAAGSNPARDKIIISAQTIFRCLAGENLFYSFSGKKILIQPDPLLTDGSPPGRQALRFPEVVSDHHRCGDVRITRFISLQHGRVPRYACVIPSKVQLSVRGTKSGLGLRRIVDCPESD